MALKSHKNIIAVLMAALMSICGHADDNVDGLELLAETTQEASDMAAFEPGFGDAVELEAAQETFYSRFIEKRLHIGLSMSESSVKVKQVPHENAFLGNLDTLTEDSNRGYGINLKYDFCEYASILFANDVGIELGAWNSGGVSTDGTLSIDGYVLEGIVQYPINACDYLAIIPYFGCGLAVLSTDWSYGEWWHHGWRSPEDYEEYAENQDDFRNGYSRWMLPDDPPTAFVWSIGVCFNVFEHLDIDVSYRKINVDDINTNFRVYEADGPLMINGAFPAEHSSFVLAARYVF